MSDKISDAFLTEDFVPRLISHPPSSLLDVDFLTGDKAYLGNNIVPDSAKDPIVKWDGDPNKYYLLSMVDVDDSLTPEGESVNWLIANIKGDGSDHGDTIAGYQAPSPPKGSKHRYLELLFEQPQKYDPDIFVLAENFSIRNFAEDYQLNPLAGNYFASSNY